jgi:hypothetical protein
MKKLYTFLFILSAFAISAQTSNPGICMVTVDDSSKHNIIYYDKTQFSAGDSVIFYRQNVNTGGYDRIGANAQTALSMFMDMDTAGNPNIMLHRYKIQWWTNNEGYSALSPYHTVLYCLQQDSNYNWNQYDIQGTGTGTVNQYVILQDDYGNGNWHPIDTVSGTTNSWVHGAVVSFPNGLWRLATLWNVSCTPTARSGNDATQTTIVRSKSNITNNRQTGIAAVTKNSSVYAYPNPTIKELHLRLDFPQAQAVPVKLYNALGVEVFSASIPAGKDELLIDVSALPHGLYIAELVQNGSKITRRIAVN